MFRPASLFRYGARTAHTLVAQQCGSVGCGRSSSRSSSHANDAVRENAHPDEHDEASKTPPASNAATAAAAAITPSAPPLLYEPPKLHVTKPGLTRTQFEDEYHLNRSLSKNTVTPTQRRQWQEQLRKQSRRKTSGWDLKPMEMHHSPPYEIQALQEIHNRSFDANVLLEIRDVRLPASSHHPSFTRLAKHRLHLICYTHADIIDSSTRDRIEAWTNISWPESRSIFVDTRENRSDLPYDMVYDSLLGYLQSRGGINTALTVGVPNTGKSSVLLALLRYARAKGEISKQIKATVSYKKKRRLGKTAPIGILDQPGKTREITEYLLREKPRAFFLDVPGITPPTFYFQERPEAWFAFGAANLMPLSKHLATDIQVQTAFCDYVLYCLNRDSNFMYVPKLGLSGPTDDVEEVLFNVKQGRGVIKDTEKLQLQRCASFLKLFNTGNLGPVILDDISKPYKKFEFKDSHFVKEREAFREMRNRFKRNSTDDDDYGDHRREDYGTRGGGGGDGKRRSGGKDDFTEDDFKF